MNRLIHSISILLFLLFSYISDAQDHQYDRFRSIENFQTGWNRIEILDDMYGKIKSDFYDIRVIGILENGDTIEAPYLLEKNLTKKESIKIPYKIINESDKNDTYFYTLDLSGSDNIINEIDIELAETNFNWQVVLEGSQDQKDWYTILDNYRIVGIQNGFANYKFTSLIFPDQKYTFFRIGVRGPHKKPALEFSGINRLIENPGKTIISAIHKQEIKEDKKYKETSKNIELEKPVPAGWVVWVEG